MWSFENITHLFEIAEAIAVVATAIFGFFTIGEWRKENLGKRKLELAEQALLSFYWYKQRIIDLRTPLPTPDHLDPVEAFQSQRSQYWHRLGWLGAIGEGGNSLYELRPQFQIYFGFDAAEPFARMLKAIDALNGPLREVFTNVAADGLTLIPLPLNLETLGWGKAHRPDHIDREVDKAVAAIEAICKPVLEGKR